MSQNNEVDQSLIERIRQGDAMAWSELIDRFEGRLIAFVDSRIRNRQTSEDIVQDTFVGFLNSLVHYDDSRPLEGYLFSICAYKLTDHLRRSGKRPTVSIDGRKSGLSGAWEIVSPRARGASTIARSVERKKIEEDAIIYAIQTQIDKWKERGDWAKLKCIELLFVVGATNKDAASLLGLTEQQVANYKSDFLTRTKSLIGRQELDPTIFPELYSQDH